MTNKIRLAFILSITIIFSIEIAAQSANCILEKRVTISFNNIEVKEALKNLSEKTGFGFSYSNDLVQLSHSLTFDFVDKPLKDILDLLIVNTSVT